jgi:vancomycin resistance protein VanJ
LLLLVAGYSLAVVVACVWMHWRADRGWLATLMLFGPRWLCALPWPWLVIAAALWHRRLLGLLLAVGVIILGPIMGFCVHLPTFRSETPQLRVLTCNVKDDSFHFASLAGIIADEQPDVVALQESIVESRFVWPPGWNVIKSGEFTLASRWSMSEPQIVRQGAFSNEVAAVRVTVSMPERDFQLFNIHLETPRAGIEALLSRRTGLDLERVAELETICRARAAESAKVSAWIAGFAGPKIVMGDFNTPVESTIYRDCWSSLGNAFSSVGWGFGFTKVSQKLGFSYGTRIDHVLFSSDWQPLYCHVCEDIGSDHLPLLAAFF